MHYARTAAVLFLMTLSLPAQDPVPAPQNPAPQNPGPSGPQNAGPQGPFEPNRQRRESSVTLAFPGGTLATLVTALRTAEPNTNIVVAPRAGDAVIPPMDLRGAGVEQALQSACMVAEGPNDISVKESNGIRPVYTIVARERRQQQQPGFPGQDPNEVFQRVFSLNHLTTIGDVNSGVEPLAVQTILSAVELATTADDKAPMMRFHKDSGILLVRGTHQQVQRASEVLAVLADDKVGREDRARRARAPAPEQPAGAKEDRR